MNTKVDWYFDKANKWKAELEKLREIVISCDLVEELKWGCPCYMFEKSNIVLIHDFKEYCAFLFFKGVLLKDKKRILVQQTENVQSARQVRFTSAAQITKMEKVLKTYIYEAVALQEAGLKVQLKKTTQYDVPEEFQIKLKKSPSLKKAFKALTPGRQRGYLIYFSQAKQSKTREARIEKCIKPILKGEGLNE